MLSAADSDTFTFRGDSTSVSFVGRAGERSSTSLTKSPALEDASANFAAIAEERANLSKSGSAADRLAAIRANIAKSRQAHDDLGQAHGIAPEPRKEASISDEARIAQATELALKRFGAPAAQAEGEPSRQSTPAFAKPNEIQKA